MELEKAGECYEPQLKRLARNVLRQRYTDGVIDDMLAPERVTYEDLARAASDTSSPEPPSILKSIFHDTRTNDALLTTWLASDARDAEIVEKEAVGELAKLVNEGELKLMISLEASPEGGVSDQKVEEIKAALRALGSNDNVRGS